MRRNRVLAAVAGLSLITAAVLIFDLAVEGRWVEAGAVAAGALLFAVCIAIWAAMQR